MSGDRPFEPTHVIWADTPQPEPVVIVHRGPCGWEHCTNGEDCVEVRTVRDTSYYEHADDVLPIKKEAHDGR